MENKIIILVGDVSEYLGKAAKDIDSRAELITSVAKINSGVNYVSLGDLHTINDFVKVLEQADTIVYTPPSEWSDCNRKGFSYMRFWTEFYMLYFKDRVEVLEIESIVPDDFEQMLSLADSRRTSNPQLWAVGCSITHGIGVDSNERYGQLLAEQLKLPVSFLTAPGSSIEWAADQILRSDIRSGDIIVWGLTSHNRRPVYTDTIKHVNVSNTTDIEWFDQPDIFYRAVTSIAQVVNFCNKSGAQLCLAGILVDSKFIHYAAQFSNYLQLFGGTGHNEDELFLDLGTDMQHPGLLTHKYYAEQIINRLNKTP